VSFVKYDMPGSDYAASAKIKASVAAVIRRIAEQGAGRGAWAEFVSGSGCLVGIAEATEHPKVTVVRRSAEKTLIGCRGATPLIVLGFRRWVAVFNASTQYSPGMPAWKRRLRTQLVRVRMMRSALPFWEDVYGQDRRSTVPWAVR
jgi:hypothetical protein